MVGGSTVTTVQGYRDASGTLYTAADDGFWGRVEVTTAAAKTNQLLNVMYVCDSNKNPAGQTAVEISASGIKGARIGKVAAIFVTSATRRTEAFSFTTDGAGDLTYYVSGVKAGKWVVRDANGNTQRITATDDGGLLVFTASAGQITLTPQ